ncbi:MAG: bifunctional folylpolyglutamate synthase/dihydrofolate synthase [Cyanophyceae cyanobacterium]
MIDDLLKPFQRFGVHLGLARIERLLAALGNPHLRMPLIHVAGTNGKGSVCAYLSAVLTEAGCRVGRYTSPHLVDWTERICLNEAPISTQALEKVLRQIQAVVDADESPTLFEVVTAAAWLYFAQEEVDLAVMEVGLGGRLDATNVCPQPLASVITSISREHWQTLGPTLADIAREKAGIVKPGCPAIIGSLPPEAKAVVAARVEQLGCPAVWVTPAQENRNLPRPNEGPRWASYQGLEYPLPLWGEVQLMNSALAVATLNLLQQQGWKIPDSAIAQGMAKARWPGRLQWTTWQKQSLLIDGAHNPAAAQALRQYVDTLDRPVSWVMGMLSTKDHADIFAALLRGGDRLYLVPVPDHSTAEPKELAALAPQICPNLDFCRPFPELFEALDFAYQSSSEHLVVLCGSLYLVGYFLRHVTARESRR